MPGWFDVMVHARKMEHLKSSRGVPAYNFAVRVLRNLCAIAVLCLWTSTPLLSCVLSFAQMNEEEMACCKQMAGDCAMNNSSHSCCKKVAQAGDVLAFSSSSTYLLLEHQLSSVELRPSVTTIVPAEHHLSIIFSPSHSPPLPNGWSLVLRI